MKDAERIRSGLKQGSDRQVQTQWLERYDQENQARREVRSIALLLFRDSSNKITFDPPPALDRTWEFI